MPYIGNNHVVGDHVNNFKVLDDISSYTATFDGSATSVVSTSDETIRIPEHRFIQGQRVTYNNGGGGNIGGLSSGTAYYVTFDTAHTIKLATSLLNANNQNNINILSVGSGSSHTLTAAFDGVNTKFKLTHGAGETIRVVNPAQLNIAINNVVQRPNINDASFTEGFAITDTEKIVFKIAPSVNDIFWGSLIGETIETFDITDHRVDNFTGDGSETEFTLSGTVPNNNSVVVTINGVVQHSSDATTARSYSIVGSILVFTSAPALGDEIQVKHIGFAGSTTGGVTGFYGRTGNVVLAASDHITTGDITARNINSSGIITATTFVGSGANLTGIDATAVKDSGGNVKIQAQASGAVYTGIHTFNSVLDVDGHTNLDNVSIAGVTTMSGSVRIESNNFQIYGTAPTIFLRDSNDNPDYRVMNSHGSYKIFDETNGVDRFIINPNGNVSILKDLDVDGHTNLDNVSVAGVITATSFVGSGANLTGVNADRLDGIDGANFLRSNTSDTMNGDLTLSGFSPDLNFVSTSNNPDWKITNYQGTLVVYDITNSANKFLFRTNEFQSNVIIDAQDGINVSGVSTFTSNVDIDGNTTFGANGSITSGANFSLSSNKLRVTGSDTVGLEVQRSSNATIQCTETTNNTDLQLRANSEGGLVRTATNYPLILGANQKEKLRIAGGAYATIGINTSTFDSGGSQIKIDGRGTGTTSPPYLQIKGVGNANLHSYVDLIATSDSNAGSSYRGLGIVMHDEPTNVEWFAGRPYAGSDKYIIGRKTPTSYRTESSEVANSLFNIDSSGNIAFNRPNANVGDSQGGNSTATPKRFVFNNNFSNGYTDSSLKLYLFNENATRQGFTSGPVYDLQYHSSGHATNTKHSFFTQNVERLRINSITNGRYLGRSPLNAAESALEIKNDVGGSTPDNDWYWIKQYGNVARLHYCVFKDYNGNDIAGGPWTMNWVAGVIPSQFASNGSTSAGRYLNLCKNIGIDKPGRGMESSRTTAQVYGAWLAVKRALWDLDPGMFHQASTGSGGVLIMPIININGEGGSSDHRVIYSTGTGTHIPPNQDGDHCNANQLFCGWWAGNDFSSWATNNNTVPSPEDWGPGDSAHTGDIGKNSNTTPQKVSFRDKMLVTCIYH